MADHIDRTARQVRLGDDVHRMTSAATVPTNDEATVVVANLPAGSTATVEVHKPAIGGKRFIVAAEGMSVQGAKDITTAAFLHVQRVAEGEQHGGGRG